MHRAASMVLYGITDRRGYRRSADDVAFGIRGQDVPKRVHTHSHASFV